MSPGLGVLGRRHSDALLEGSMAFRASSCRRRDPLVGPDQLFDRRAAWPKGGGYEPVPLCLDCFRSCAWPGSGVRWPPRTVLDLQEGPNLASPAIASRFVAESPCVSTTISWSAHAARRGATSADDASHPPWIERLHQTRRFNCPVRQDGIGSRHELGGGHSRRGREDSTGLHRLCHGHHRPRH